jgi:energy-converting hydrogenase Eha subunit E
VDQIFLLLLTVATSLGAVVVGVRVLGLVRARLKTAVHCALELVGVSVVFFVVNLIVALPVILAVRAFTSQFLSVYLLNDLMLIVLSTLQGIVFCCWRRA